MKSLTTLMLTRQECPHVSCDYAIGELLAR